MRKVSRSELLMALDIAKPVELNELLEGLYAAEEEKARLNRRAATSFYPSAFPGDEGACPRLPLYKLMGIPEVAPVKPANRAIMDAGEDIEHQTVMRFQRAGILVSAPPGQKQTAMKMPEFWLSGKLDAAIVPPGWDRPHIVEIKGADHEVVVEYQRGQREVKPTHKYQCCFYIVVAFLQADSLFPGLRPCESGTVLYLSRQRPRTVAEFPFTLAEAWEVVKPGLDRVAAWRDAFIMNHLPARPEEFMWSSGECKFCPVKKFACKPDHLAGVEWLDESAGIEYASTVNPNYRYEAQRRDVLARWSTNNNMKEAVA